MNGAERLRQFVAPYDDGRELPPIEDHDDEPAWDGDPDADEKAGSAALQRMRGRLVRGLALSALPRPEWLVEDLLPAPSLGFLYGPPKTGKSFAAIDLACSVASGRPWCGKPTRRGKVLYVVGEGVSGVVSRQDAWSAYNGVTDLEDMIWHPGAVNLASHEQATALAELAAEEGVALVVIDTLARCTAGADENSTKEMGLFVEACDRVRDASGAAVIVVHHSGKDKAKGMRGATALLGAADVVLEVSGGTGRVRLEVTDAKDFPSGFAVTFGMEQVGESIVLVEGTSGDARAASAKASEALAALAEAATAEGLSSKAWLNVAEMSDSSFYRARKYLVDRGLVRNVGTEKMPRYVVGVSTS